jgi:hypothetical protein
MHDKAKMIDDIALYLLHTQRLNAFVTIQPQGGAE